MVSLCINQHCQGLNLLYHQYFNHFKPEIEGTEENVPVSRVSYGVPSKNFVNRRNHPIFMVIGVSYIHQQYTGIILLYHQYFNHFKPEIEGTVEKYPSF